MILKGNLFKAFIVIYCYNNNAILKVNRWNLNKKVKLCIQSILYPYFTLNCIISILIEQLYSIKRIQKLNQIDNKKSFKHDLAIVCISKNEGPYLKEWIEYHKLIGISKFYFYDNESNDNTYDIIQPYIKSGLVEYSIIKGIGQQLNAYNDAIKKHKDECRYMAFIDLDEYLFPMYDSNKSISDVITSLLIKAGKGASGISINWCVFGSSNYEKRPQGLITESYILRSKPNHWTNYHIKTICNPRRVKKYISAHYPQYQLGAYSISDSNLKRQHGWFCHEVLWKYFRINHYYCKSKEDYVIKTSRGLGDRAGKYDLNKFNIYDLNDIKDNSMIKFSKKINIK